MKKVTCIAILTCLVMSSPALAEYIVDMPDNIPGITGQIVTAPVEIDNADGVCNFEFTITYDTTLLDLSGSDVQLGSLTSSWGYQPTVDDSLGLATIMAWGTEALGAASGSLLELDFHVTGTSGSSPLELSGLVNEVGIAPCSGSIDIVPEPTMVASLLGLLVAAVLVFKRRG